MADMAVMATTHEVETSATGQRGMGAGELIGNVGREAEGGFLFLSGLVGMKKNGCY